MGRAHMTDEQRWEIAQASLNETDAAVAKRIGSTKAAVNHARRKILTEGFHCRIYWATCLECGRLIAGQYKFQGLHPACKLERRARRIRS